MSVRSLICKIYNKKEVTGWDIVIPVVVAISYIDVFTNLNRVHILLTSGSNEVSLSNLILISEVAVVLVLSMLAIYEASKILNKPLLKCDKYKKE